MSDPRGETFSRQHAEDVPKRLLSHGYSNNHQGSGLQGIAGRVQVSTHGCKWGRYPGLSS